MGNACPSKSTTSQLLTLTQNLNGKTNKCADIHLGERKKKRKKIRKMCKNLKIKAMGEEKEGLLNNQGCIQLFLCESEY